MLETGSEANVAGLVVDERGTGAQSFRQPLLSVRRVVVDEVNTGLRGDVTKLHLLCERRDRQQRN